MPGDGRMGRVAKLIAEVTEGCFLGRPLMPARLLTDRRTRRSERKEVLQVDVGYDVVDGAMIPGGMAVRRKSGVIAAWNENAKVADIQLRPWAAGVATGERYRVGILSHGACRAHGCFWLRR